MRVPARGARCARATAAAAAASAPRTRAATSPAVGAARRSRGRGARRVARLLERRLLGRRRSPSSGRAPNEKSDRWRTVCSVSAEHASSHTGSPVRLAPIARPANAMYSFVRSKIESSQAPSLENVRV